MSIGTMLGNLLIGPLELLFEVIYSSANRVLTQGWSIFVLSMAVNLLVLPLYQRADRIQQETRETEERMTPGIRHIKSVFQGDEQFFMLQTYYRQNHYSPFHTIRSALPLALQVPFFIAAYQFLSHLGSLRGASFGPIADLGQPDGLLLVGGFTVNLLPILMTIINLLSSALYLKGAPLKSKLQLLGMALIFLVLLYDSPAGLTFYWMLNNLFSLGKNILQNSVHGGGWSKTKFGFAEPTTCSTEVKAGSQHDVGEKSENGVFGRSGGGIAKSLVCPRLRLSGPNLRLFLLSALVLTVLTGLLIPSAVLASSLQEFYEYSTDLHPLWYMGNSFLLAAGTFLLWFSIYYALAGATGKKAMEIGMWAFSILGPINYLFFRNNLGTISSTLEYAFIPSFSISQKLINLAFLAIGALVLCILCIRKEKLIQWVSLVLVLSLGGMSLRNAWIIRQGVAEAIQVMDRNYSGAEEIPLSKEGKNVVVLFLDRAISYYLPCILYEKPELKEVYSGFVYYPNTLSHGMHTNLGAPGMFGGYEYTPWAMNKRDTLSLREKHNEALLLMPTLFSQEGYRVSVFDVPYPGNYSEVGDYSLFDDLPNTNARKLTGALEHSTQHELAKSLRLRNFFCYSLSMIAPTMLFEQMYRNGNYNRAEGAAILLSDGNDGTSDIYLDAATEFIPPYEVLKNLGELTALQEDGNTFLILGNNTAHSPTPLQEPEYIPGDTSGNAAYDAAHEDRFLAGPFQVLMGEYEHMTHYHANMAAIIQTGEWLQKLKEMNVYDNTRIIIVADHAGYQLLQIVEGVLSGEDDISGLNPLLMVKDFGATGEICTDTTFMTNADVPALALSGLIDNPVNPFTGNPINSNDKMSPQYVSFSHFYDISTNNGNCFMPSRWYTVTPGGDTLYNLSRWIYLGDGI